MNNLSLYIHIPFCVRKCNYCAFYSLPSQLPAVKAAYTKALIRQINSFETAMTVSSVYIGGGTPPVIGRANLVAILDAVTKRFHLASDCEITVEINPGTVDLAFMRDLKLHGVNRVSVGVQSFCADELQLMGRIHTDTADKVGYVLRSVLASGIDNISADLIFALPYQKKQNIAYSMDMLLHFGLPHFSVYSLQHEEGTPFFDMGDRLSYPSEDEEEEMYDLICRKAESAGYTHYEISSFAKDEKRYSRHNMNYWSCGEYFGFGVAAHSYLYGKRFSSPPDIDGYLRAMSVPDALAPTDFDKVFPLSETDKAEEGIMLGLRTVNGVDASALDAKKLSLLVSKKLGRINDGRFSLTDRGYRVSNAIIAELLL